MIALVERRALRAMITPRWQREAVCAGTPVSDWFPDHGQEPYAARQFCRECPVRVSCLATALVQQEQGIWSGTTEADRALGVQLLRAGVPVLMVLDVLLNLPTVRYRFHWSAA